jgi:hypothetical protein
LLIILQVPLERAILESFPFFIKEILV